MYSFVVFFMVIFIIAILLVVVLYCFNIHEKLANKMFGLAKKFEENKDEKVEEDK